jgi:hypothetical protein
MKCENCDKELEYKDVFELKLCMGQMRINLCKSCYYHALGKEEKEIGEQMKKESKNGARPSTRRNGEKRGRKPSGYQKLTMCYCVYPPLFDEITKKSMKLNISKSEVMDSALSLLFENPECDEIIMDFVEKNKKKHKALVKEWQAENLKD